MPAPSELLALFSAHHAGCTSDKTLNNWLTGLHFWHTVNGAPWNSDSMLHHVRRGFSKLVPPLSRCAKRPPVTLEALCILHDHLDLSNSFDLAIWALTSIAFWCCYWSVRLLFPFSSSHLPFSLGELLIPDANSFTPFKHVSHNVLPLSCCSLNNGTQYSSFHIPWSKTMLNNGADISVTAHSHHTCLLHTLTSHLSSNNSISSSAPLFAFHTSGSWSPMTCTWFLQCCNQVWVSAGFPDMPSHAFHIGGATANQQTSPFA